MAVPARLISRGKAHSVSVAHQAADVADQSRTHASGNCVQKIVPCQRLSPRAMTLMVKERLQNKMECFIVCSMRKELPAITQQSGANVHPLLIAHLVKEHCRYVQSMLIISTVTPACYCPGCSDYEPDCLLPDRSVVSRKMIAYRNLSQKCPRRQVR